MNTFVLSWLVEKVTGLSYEEVVSQTLWQHMGAEADAGIVVSNTGAPGSHGLMYSTLRDLARYGMLFDAYNYYALGSASHTVYQWDFVTKDGDFAKGGFHGQTLYISPRHDLVVASFATGQEYDTFKFARAVATRLNQST